MATIALVGGGGVTGGLVAAGLRDRGHAVVPLARDGASAAGLAGCDAVIVAGGPCAEVAVPVLEAALRAGVHYLDASLEPAHTAWVHGQDGRAREAGSVVVSAGGFPAALLDLLGAVTLGAVTGGEELHLATTFPHRGWLAHGLGPATRRVLADQLAGPVPVRRDGRAREEGVAEARRLAWFPRPVGLAHAAAVPGTAVSSVTRRQEGLAVAREYLAMTGWRAEVLQLAASAMRWAPARRRLHRLVRGAGVAPVPRRRAGVRWACVAETRGEEGTARAWANGWDPAATAAASLVLLAETAVRDPAPGVRTPAQLAPPVDLLDGLSAARDLRWSVIRP